MEQNVLEMLHKMYVSWELSFQLGGLVVKMFACCTGGPGLIQPRLDIEMNEILEFLLNVSYSDSDFLNL